MRIWGRLALMVFCRRLSEGRGAVSSRLKLKPAVVDLGK